MVRHHHTTPHHTAQSEASRNSRAGLHHRNRSVHTLQFIEQAPRGLPFVKRNPGLSGYTIFAATLSRSRASALIGLRWSASNFCSPEDATRRYLAQFQMDL